MPHHVDLWIGISLLLTVKADLPQVFSVTEEGGSPQTYDCNSYVKQFTAINQVRFEQLRDVGVQCNCRLRVPTSSATADTTEILSVDMEFGLPDNVVYGSFKDCQAHGSQLQFEVQSSVPQTKIVLKCVSTDIILNGGSDNNAIAVTKSPGFSDDVSMTCESATLITTPEMNDTSSLGATTDPGPAPGDPDDNPDAGQAGQSSDSEGLGGRTIAIISGFSAAIVMLFAALIAVILIKFRKPQIPDVPREIHGHVNQGMENKSTSTEDDMYLGLETPELHQSSEYTGLEIPQDRDYVNVQNGTCEYVN